MGLHPVTDIWLVGSLHETASLLTAFLKIAIRKTARPTIIARKDRKFATSRRESPFDGCAVERYNPFMTIMLELTAEEEARLSARAQEEGCDLPAYVRRILGISAATSLHDQKPKTGADLLATLKSLNLPPGYGDPSIDSPELARRLREHFSRPRQGSTKS